MDVTDFGGQNWLIMPAARAVNEAAPANISRQRWLLVISGVTSINMQGRTSDDWLRDDIHILPDMHGPLDSAINQYGIPRPQGTEGLNYEVGFQLRQWSPFAGLSSTFDQDQSVNAGFAVDGWRPAPFTVGTDAFWVEPVEALATGLSSPDERARTTPPAAAAATSKTTMAHVPAPERLRARSLRISISRTASCSAASKTNGWPTGMYLSWTSPSALA